MNLAIANKSIFKKCRQKMMFSDMQEIKAPLTNTLPLRDVLKEFL